MEILVKTIHSFWQKRHAGLCSFHVLFLKIQAIILIHNNDGDPHKSALIHYRFIIWKSYTTKCLALLCNILHAILAARIKMHRSMEVNTTQENIDC